MRKSLLYLYEYRWPNYVISGEIIAIHVYYVFPLYLFAPFCQCKLTRPNDNIFWLPENHDLFEIIFFLNDRTIISFFLFAKTRIIMKIIMKQWKINAMKKAASFSETTFWFNSFWIFTGHHRLLYNWLTHERVFLYLSALSFFSPHLRA